MPSRDMLDFDAMPCNVSLAPTIAGCNGNMPPKAWLQSDIRAVLFHHGTVSQPPSWRKLLLGSASSSQFTNCSHKTTGVAPLDRVAAANSFKRMAQLPRADIAAMTGDCQTYHKVTQIKRLEGLLKGIKKA